MAPGQLRTCSESSPLPRPRKRLGQHFLRDRSLLSRIVAAADLSPEDTVLEIGPGTGALTYALAGAAGQVVAVELDDTLFDVLDERYRMNAHVEIVHGNALAFDPCDRFEGSYKVVANIPYYITGPILRHFLESSCPPELLVLMVQREVAERIAAPPGELSLLGVSVQRFAEASIVLRVPAGAFHPRPKVDSAVVRLVPHRERRWLSNSDDFFAVARAGFGLRRKQLINSLAHGLSIDRARANALLASAGIEPARRAETLSLAEWDRLVAAWEAQKAVS
jgi:16S rRNA (adenine1518-N6/adenine1519-N6)-dimethyltransferase